jgi:hypothetical protein
MNKNQTCRNKVEPNYDIIREYAPHLLKQLKMQEPETEMDMIDYIIENKPPVSKVRKFFEDHIELMKEREEKIKREKISRSFQ